jgi:hypothetical protein
MVLGLIFGCVLALFLPVFWLVIGAGILFYGATAFYFGAKMSDKKGEILGITSVFPILHFSYGFGYLMGVIDFLIFNKKPSTKSKELSRK